MAKTAVVVDKEYLKHQPGESHPERPERVKVLLDLASELDTAKFQLLPPQPAHASDIAATHGEEHIKLIEATAQHNRYALGRRHDHLPRFVRVSVYWRWAGSSVCSMRSLPKIAATVSLWCGHRAIMPCAIAPWGFVFSTPWRSAPSICSAAHGAKKILDHGLGRAPWQRHAGCFLRRSFGAVHFDPSVSLLSRQRCR